MTAVLSPSLLSIGPGRLWWTGNAKVLPVPPELRRTLAPAEYILFEWSDYWLRWPDATRLRSGDRWFEPIEPGLFHLRFENQLGLTHLQPYAGDQPLAFCRVR